MAAAQCAAPPAPPATGEILLPEPPAKHPGGHASTTRANSRPPGNVVQLWTAAGTGAELTLEADALFRINGHWPRYFGPFGHPSW